MQPKDFFCILKCYGLEEGFIAELKNVDYQNLQILGLTKINPFSFEQKYFSNHIKDISIDPNANVDGVSPNNFYMESTKSLFKLMTFYKIWQKGKELYNDFTLAPLLKGYVYFHDATKGYVPYCVGASCLDIIQNGRPYGEPISFPPKRADSYVALCTEFLMDLSQEFAGAVAFTDFLVGLAWFSSKGDSQERNSDSYIENRIQSFVHVCSNKFRVGGDSLCYDEEIIIKNEEGEIKFIKIGDFSNNFKTDCQAFSFNRETGKTEWKKITKSYIHENPNDMCKITLGSMKTIHCTKNHSLFTINNGKIETCAPSENPKIILVPKKLLLPENPTSLKIDDIGGRRKYPKKIYIDEELAWAFGLYCGDGHCDGSSISYSLYNRRLEDEIIRIFQEKFNCNYNIHKGNSDKGRGGDIRFNAGINLVDAFKENFGNGAINKKISSCILNARPNIKRAFIEGLIDSDGYIGEKGFSIGVISEKLIDGIRILCSSLGLMTRENVRNFDKLKDFGSYKSKQNTIFRIWIPNEWSNDIHPIKGNTKRCSQHHYPYDYEFLRPLLKSFYRHHIILKSKGCFKITTEMVENWYTDIKKRRDKVKETEDLEKIAEMLCIPKRTNYKGYKYNIFKKTGLESFLKYKNSQILKLNKLYILLRSLQNLIPMKVSYIEDIPKQEKSYDISVEDNENFLTKNLIFAHNSPFSNISVNSEAVLHEVFDNYIFPDGRRITDFMEEIMRVQRIFIEFMYKGRPEANGLPYKFPVVTANFKKENIDDQRELKTEWFDYISRKNHKGFININTSPRFAMCCRLNIDQFKFNSFGGGGLKLGSFRVVNINLPKLALSTWYEFCDSREEIKKLFFILLINILKYSHRLLSIEREILKEKIEQKFLKFFNLDWFNLDNMFFGTLSFHGLSDSLEYLLDKNTTHPEGQEMTNKIIDMFLKEAQSETEYHINLEQAPSESATNTMAKLNKDSVEFYSNQFVPLELPIELSERIRIEGMFTDRLTGGSMCLINLDGEMDEEQSLKLHKYIYENSLINQWCPNYGWTVCENGHSHIGEFDECPTCKNTDLKHYERVVGYFVNRDVVNEGRQIEMINRVRHSL